MKIDERLIAKKDANKSSLNVEVSYVVIKVDQTAPIKTILQKIATTINIQLTSEEEQEQDLLPFIPFNGFENAKCESNVEKLCANATNNLSLTTSLDPISEAENLLRRTVYYEHQFSLITSLGERQADAEFLYALKLCYELGLSRTITFIEKLQKGIFNSISKDPFRRLSSWIYLSGQFCSMHDVCKDAIKFNDFVKLKILRHLTAEFFNIIPAHNEVFK